MGAVLLVRREAADTVGLFDEDFFMFSEETDWCYRFRQAGWKVLFTPDAEFVHVGGATTKKNWGPMFREQVRGHLRFLAKHRGRREAERARRLLLVSLRLRGIAVPRRARPHLRRDRALAGGLVGRGAAGAVNPAVVVDVGWVNGLAAIRSLGRAGVRVLALDHRPSALGFRSRYAEPVLTPDPQDEEAFVDFLAGLDVEGAPVFATHDEPLNAIARAAGRLGGRFLYPFPPWEVLARIQTKRGQLEAAEAAGIPVPRTAYPASAAEARAAAERARLPGAGQAVVDRGLQAALQAPGLPLRDRGRGRGARTRRPSRTSRWCRR